MTDTSSLGARWLAALTDNAAAVPGYPASVRVVDGTLAGMAARFIAVVPDPDSRYPRARNGEVGLAEGWALARAVREAMSADDAAKARRAIVAVVDVPSQAYGRTEEAYGLHQALAGAAEAYACARRAGHPVLGLIVGQAMSGGFLAHGYQANRLIALSGDAVQVHAMGKQAAARITQRSVEGVEALARTITPMAYDIDSYASLGLLYRRLDVAAEDTSRAEAVRDALVDAIEDIGDTRDLADRHAREGRVASHEVRRRLREQWAG
ncbi:MAG: biotin-independent malonate decarboxylase subunit gamma [Salinisphaera sp.]|uniref:biotin-independent malonate decarboxylase subunit gamma n=1 Tax=Salinisphaera sp. TaxID=1914330 RepID=UPI003C7D3E4E